MAYKQSITSVKHHWLILSGFEIRTYNEHFETRMWANIQRGGHPAEYSWCPLFNAAVWLAPTAGMPCSNEAKTLNPLKFAWVPQTTEPISAASGPKFTIIVRTCGETLLSIRALVAKI